MSGGIGNPQSLNRYAYAMGDPVNLVDPAGLSTFLSTFFDAGLLGPGLYIDVIRVITEGEYQMFFGLLSSGAGALAPMGATITQRNGGYYLNIDNGDPYRLSVTFVQDQWYTSFMKPGPLWNNTTVANQGRLIYVIQQLLANNDCVAWFQELSNKLGYGAKLDELLKKTGMSSYATGQDVSLQGLQGLHTSQFGSGGINAETLFGGSSSRQVVWNQLNFHRHSNSQIAEDLIHELFHAAGKHKEETKGFWHPTDLPSVPWSEINKHCAGTVK